MSSISTHVLDTSRGRPAVNLLVILEHFDSGNWKTLTSCPTDKDGRIKPLLPANIPLRQGRYRLIFQIKPYFGALQTPCFYPQVVVEIDIESPIEHYHVPLLICPFGYSTYRGS